MDEKDLSALAFFAEAAVANPRRISDLSELAEGKVDLGAAWGAVTVTPELAKAITTIRVGMEALLRDHPAPTAEDLRRLAKELTASGKAHKRLAGQALQWAIQNHQSAQADRGDAR